VAVKGHHFSLAIAWPYVAFQNKPVPAAAESGDALQYSRNTVTWPYPEPLNCKWDFMSSKSTVLEFPNLASGLSFKVCHTCSTLHASLSQPNIVRQSVQALVFELCYMMHCHGTSPDASRRILLRALCSQDFSCHKLKAAASALCSRYFSWHKPKDPAQGFVLTGLLLTQAKGSCSGLCAHRTSPVTSWRLLLVLCAHRNSCHKLTAAASASCSQDFSCHKPKDPAQGFVLTGLLLS
jgi:hypothetical protein